MSEITPEQATPEAVAPETPEAPAEEWSGVSQEDWQSTQQTLQEQREAIEYFAGLMQPQLPQQPQAEPITVDPLDDSFQQQLDRYLEDKFAPYGEYVQAQQIREGDARAQDILADIASRDGEFLLPDSTEKARTLANSFIGETNQQFPGEPVRAAEAALEMAAKAVREWETAVGKAYHERQLNQLSTLSGARPELGVGANGTQQFTIPQGGGLVDVARRHGQLQGR